MSVHLWRYDDPMLDQAVEGFEWLAATTKRGHTLSDDPGAADLVLFTQAHVCPDPLSLRAFRRSEAWTRHRHKCFAVDYRDRPWCAFPGLYTSMPSAAFRPKWQRAWLYPWIEEGRFTSLRQAEPDLLFSFVGGRTHPCRDEILSMTSDRAVIEDSTAFTSLGSSDEARSRRELFHEVLSRSKFVLCPRGHGTGSFRLQEVLAAGRVPVIISDDWVEPEGPDWEAATVRWPERHIAELPAHLEAIEGAHADMARAARGLYDEWFAADTMFDRIIDQILRIEPGRFPVQGVKGRWYGRLLLAEGRDRLKRATTGRTGSAR